MQTTQNKKNKNILTTFAETYINRTNQTKTKSKQQTITKTPNTFIKTSKNQTKITKTHKNQSTSQTYIKKLRKNL